MSETVLDVIKEINATRTQTSSSNKDEIRVMKAILNDPDFKVDIYNNTGVVGSYSPYDESRTLVSNIIRDTAKITKREAMELAQNYEFGNQESKIMIGLSKEFINTYIETGRKLPLGGREKSNISIAKRVKEKHVGEYPKKVGVNADGTDKYENVKKTIPEHGSIKVYSSCPSWLK